MEVVPEFSDELIKQIETISNVKLDKNTDSTKIKFDDEGTVYLRSYNSDGKNLDTIPLQDMDITKEEKEVEESSSVISYKEQIEQLRKQNNKTTKMTNASLLIVGALLGFAILIIFMFMR